MAAKIFNFFFFSFPISDIRKSDNIADVPPIFILWERAVFCIKAGAVGSPEYVFHRMAGFTARKIFGKRLFTLGTTIPEALINQLSRSCPTRSSGRLYPNRRRQLSLQKVQCMFRSTPKMPSTVLSRIKRSWMRCSSRASFAF